MGTKLINVGGTFGERSQDELEFLSEALDEVYRARAKFPDSYALMRALTEEVGELAKALMEESTDRVRAEAVQVACVALRLALEGDPSLNPVREKTAAGAHPAAGTSERRV